MSGGRGLGPGEGMIRGAELGHGKSLDRLGLGLGPGPEMFQVNQFEQVDVVVTSVRCTMDY